MGRNWILALAVAVLVTGAAWARVVRPAPDFTWQLADGSARTLASLRGQSAVLLVAPSPRDGRFRAQVRQLEAEYQRFAAKGLVCFAAFTEEGGRVDSNIPFVVAADGPRVAFVYEVVEGFAMGLIGPDGNLDYLTNRVVPAQRVYDILGNNAAVQDYLRGE